MKALFKTAGLALLVVALLIGIAGAVGQTGPVGYAYMSTVCGPFGQCQIQGTPAVQNLWQTGFDCNFNTATPQILTQVDGGAVSACGYAGTRNGGGFDHAAPVIDGGLIFQCQDVGGVTDPYQNANIQFPLSSLIPNLNGTMSLRLSVWVQNPTSGSTVGNYEWVALINEPLSGLSTAETSIKMYRQFNEWVGVMQPISSQTVTADSLFSTVQNEGIVYVQNLSTSFVGFMQAQYDGGMPSLGAEYEMGFSELSNEGSGTNTLGQGQPSSWSLFIGCSNGGGGTETTNFGRVKLEYHP